MDILAHGLWTGLAAKAANIKIRWAVFSGVLPDFFAFTIPFVVMFARGVFPFRPGEPPRDIDQIFKLTPILYSISHSLIVLGTVFGLVFLVLRRPVRELLLSLFFFCVGKNQKPRDFGIYQFYRIGK